MARRGPGQADGRWWKYVMHVTGDAPQYRIAEKLGVSDSVVSRWKSGAQPLASNVVAFARSYARSPLEALVAADYLTPEEAGLPADTDGLAAYSTDVMLDEILRRRALQKRETDPPDLGNDETPPSR